MERLHPGVYIEEIASGVRPIEGVSTSTAAFLGRAEMGPLDRAFMVTSFIEFQKNYGGFLSGSYLAHAALHFFNNGGKRLYIVRVAKDPTTALTAVVDRKSSSPVKTLTVTAINAGSWGNGLTFTVANGTINPTNDFKLTISKGATSEVFDNLSMHPDALNFVERVVSAASQLAVATANAANDATSAGTSVSGASPAPSLSPDKRKLFIDINNDGPQSITIGGSASTSAEIVTALTTAITALAPLKGSTPPAAYASATVGFASGVYTITSGVAGKQSSVRITSDPTANNAATLLKLGVTNGGTETTGAAELRPANGTYSVGNAPIGGSVVSSVPGGDGATPQNTDYTNALSRLDAVRDVNMIAVPGIGSKEIVGEGSSYCSNRQDCFFIGDMAVTDDTKEEAKLFVEGLPTKSSYVAVYFPWLKALDPTGGAATIAVPPSGYVAGIYARTDSRRGVWKAPAGTEANLGGVVGVMKQISDAEQDILNPIGVNVIRVLPSAGAVIWGARTLDPNAEYRYIPIRRLAIFIEQSIYYAIQWAVFEPNDEDLWSSLRLNIGAFMMNLFRAGAFQGQTPSQAFFVKCDAQTNPQSEINAGYVNVLIGFAPLRPAEFVIIKISQKTGDPAS